MTQKAKRFLRQASVYGKLSSFHIHPSHGGYAGSLVGLGHIVREVGEGNKPLNTYRITQRGLDWIER